MSIQQMSRKERNETTATVIASDKVESTNEEEESVALSPTSKTRMRKAREYKKRKERKEVEVRKHSAALEVVRSWAPNIRGNKHKFAQKEDHVENARLMAGRYVDRIDEAQPTAMGDLKTDTFKGKSKASLSSSSTSLDNIHRGFKRKHSVDISEEVHEEDSANLSPASKIRARKAREYKRRKERKEDEKLHGEADAFQSAPAWALDIFERIGSLVKEVSQLDAASQ